MTTPGQSAPEGAYVVGGDYGSNWTESSAKEFMKGGPINSFESAQNGFLGWIGDLINIPFQIINGILGLVGGGDPASLFGNFMGQQAMTIAEADLRVRTLAALTVTTGEVNGYSFERSIYGASGTWTKPTPAAGKRIVKIGVCCINGGCGGGGAPGNMSGDSNGGIDGGYTYREVLDIDVPASVTVTVGTGGYIDQAVGGVSSFGSILQGAFGISTMYTQQGFIQTANRPGKGGNGGWGSGNSSYGALQQTPGKNGESSALAGGGAGAGPGGNGAGGANASSDPFYVAGGGGGGGGGGSASGYNSFGGVAPGWGGPGGAPGGGGGAAGGGGLAKGTPHGHIGGAGSVTVWVFYEDIPA